jgi:CHAP domain
MASVSGLARDQRIRARDRTVQAALLALHHKAKVHYTQEPKRWDGIANRRNARTGEFPTHADCSSFATWCLWNGLRLGFGLGDIVNGHGWTAGFTGTMLDHGKRVRHLANVQRGDCVFYGAGPPGEHVTIVVAVKGGIPMVVSHGSEPGPFHLKHNYRGDVLQIRRYI